MPPRFDLYIRRNSWLHRLDPRVKFLFVAESTLLLFVWPRVWLAAAVVLLDLLLLWQAQVPRDRVVGAVRALAPLLILVFVLTSLFTQAGGPPVLLHIGPVIVTLGAVQLGAMLALRLLALALTIFLWLFTTDQAAMVRGFVALGLPYSWGLALALALRYLPIFAGLFEQVREAQQARGLELDQGKFWHRLSLHRPVLVSMIIIAVRQSEQLGWALEARAFGASGTQRTVFRPLHLQRLDWLSLAVLAILMISVVALRVL